MYWKPTIVWIIDEVMVLEPIRTESKGIRPIRYYGGNDLAYYTYLKNVRYLVKAHFEFNLNRPDLEKDRNENKHYSIAMRSLSKGGRRDIFLGCRECQGYVEEAGATQSINGFYDESGEIDFGLMYHSISYPDEGTAGELETLFWHPKMIDGVIKFIRPEECEKRVHIRTSEMKSFNDTNVLGVDEEFRRIGGDVDELDELPVRDI